MSVEACGPTWELVIEDGRHGAVAEQKAITCMTAWRERKENPEMRRTLQKSYLVQIVVHKMSLSVQTMMSYGSTRLDGLVNRTV